MILYVVWKRPGDFSTKASWLRKRMPENARQLQALIRGIATEYGAVSESDIHILNMMELRE